MYRHLEGISKMWDWTRFEGTHYKPLFIIQEQNKSSDILQLRH